jgi:uncharacterized protein (TIGR02452 family)
MNRKHIAQETVWALERGAYKTANGTVVDISDQIKQCVSQTRLLLPEPIDRIRENVLSQPAEHLHTVFEVVNETTLQGCSRLIKSGQYQRIAALNFASAKNPGGGFLAGANAQEESLARSSALYKSLMQCPTFYSFHRQQQTSLYSDRIIYSPDCPIFRKDDGTWRDAPLLVDFITSPAPNAGSIMKNEPHNVSLIESVLHERSSKVLALATANGCDAIVLGAWGCGVFRNDPDMVSEIFWEHLGPHGQFSGRFRKVVFSVLDRSPMFDMIQPFTYQFAAVI